MLGKVEKRSSTRDRVKPTRETQVRIVSAEAAGSVLTVTFDQPVVLRGTPKWTTDVAGDPEPVAVSAANPTLNTVEITFDAVIATATEITIPVADPAIRSKVGGFVADTTFAL